VARPVNPLGMTVPGDGDEGATPTTAGEAAFVAAPEPVGALALLLHLSYVRSLYAVGQALWTQFPTEREWAAALASPEFITLVSQLAELIARIKAVKSLNTFELEALAEQHYAAALDAATLIADDLAVDPRDLVNLLIHV
jgi:hypothetical protein